MNTEDLVMKHLGKDMTKEAFWKQGIDIMVDDVNTFLELTEKYI